MRWLKAIGALAALAALLVGVPTGLIMSVGNPWPAEGISPTAPLTDNAIIGLLAAVVWVLWAQLLVSVTIETVTAARSRHSDVRVPGVLNTQRHLARTLITSIAVVLVAAPITATVGTATAQPSAAQPAAGQAINHVGDHVHDQTTTGTSVDAPRDGETGQHKQQADAQDKDTSQQVTVQRGDTLWSLAERHLGAGDRWQEIADLNEGGDMGDGRTFRSTDLIRPGWNLTLPAHATGASNTSGATDYTVQAGDTLSGIAESELGDASQYSQIFTASTDITQPGGAHLTDPDHIEPGWRLATGEARNSARQSDTESNSTSAPQSRSPHPSGQSQAPTDSRRQIQPHSQNAEPGPATKDAAEHKRDSHEAASAHTSNDDGISWPIRTTGGIGALLAGSLVSLLIARRRRQQQQRQPGQRIPVPHGQAQATEIELRSVADLQMPERLDTILKALAASYATAGTPLPLPHAVRVVTEAVEVYLTEPSQLPEPWTQVGDGGTVWSSPLRVPEHGDLGAIPAPYPTLVTLGHDDDDATVLVNLEAITSLGATGVATYGQQLLSAMALELATSPWAAAATITVCGAWADLPHMVDSDRIRYVPTVDELDVVSGVEVLFLTEEQPDGLRERLAARSAIVHPGPSASNWQIEISDNQAALLQPLGLPLQPQRLTSRDWESVSESLETSLASPGNGPVGTVDSRPTTPPTTSHAQAAAPAAIRETTSADEHVDAGPAGTTATLTAPPETTTQAAVDAHPRIRIMAPSAAIIGAGQPPSHHHICVRIAVFLALHPSATRYELAEAIWPGQRIASGTISTRVSQLRTWLGTNPNTEKPYLPPNSLQFDADISTDWDEFTNLVGADVATAATSDLEAALALIYGRPFEGENPRHYAFAEFVAQEMISAIVDAAYELAHRQYANGKWRAVEEAAALGVQFEPGTERLWRIWIQAAHAAHSPRSMAEAIDRMNARITELGFDLEPETLELIDALQRHENPSGQEAL